jgi:hypothetical protein
MQSPCQEYKLLIINVFIAEGRHYWPRSVGVRRQAKSQKR